MQILKLILLGLFGAAGGMVSAAGLFALITTVGIVNRFAKVTHTASHERLYEDMIIIGATIGNLLSVYRWTLHLGNWFVGLFGLIAGMYVGVLVVCLAETLKALPIFIRRARITAGIGYIILFLALGKGVGSLIYLFILYVK